MIGSTLYLACRDAKTGMILPGSDSCSMCKRLIINAGVKEVIIRDTENTYRIVPVSRWIDHDDSLFNEEEKGAFESEK